MAGNGIPGQKVNQAAPCGLYCGICPDNVEKHLCHGCGCACGKCTGTAHIDRCAIAKCVEGRALESCADCGDLPCTELIQFCVDPIWRTHLPVIENLRRRKKIGTERWLAAQERYWADAKRRDRWSALAAECSRRHREATEKAMG